MVAQIRFVFLVAGFWAISVAGGQLPSQALPPPTAGQQDALSKLQRKYNNEHNPVHKAKVLVRLGELQVAAAAGSSHANDYAAALEKVQQYRGEIDITHSALLGSGANFARNPDGLRQLQLSLRENLRRIQDLVLAMPASQRSIFVAVQQELEAQNQKMIDELFPDLEPAPAKPPRHP